MTTISDLVGYLDAAGSDPLGTAVSFLPTARRQRPVTPYGRRGLYVVMAPITDLTPAGVFPGEQPFVFQCPPMNEFGETGAYNHQDYDTISSGQHTQSLGRQLRTVQFDTIFLDWQPEFSFAHDTSGVYPAQQAVKDLCTIRDHGKPFHLLAHQSNAQEKYEIDYAATLRQVSWKIQAGEVDAYYVTVQFTEFSTPDIREMIAGSSGNAGLPASLPVASLPTNRNTTAKMAKYYYGDPTKWRIIAARNGITSISQNTVITSRNTGRARITVPALSTVTKPKRKVASAA